MIPNIEKYDLKNIFNINTIFTNCSSLINLPDISNWFIYHNHTPPEYYFSLDIKRIISSEYFYLILFTLLVFYLEISGNLIKDEQSENM